MKFMTSALFSITVCLAGAATAEGWTHASPGLSQFEGTFDASGGNYGMNYACSPSYSQIGFRAQGLHIAAGESKISVDGVELVSGNTTYNSKWDATSFTNQVEAEWGARLKEAHNNLINALARGTEAIWTTPSGDSFTIDLTGSSGIKNCVIE